MNITVTPRGVLQIDGARICYRNFRGEGSMYNREGDKNFSLVIPSQEIADDLIKEGWNIKIKPPREEGDEAFITLGVKVKFNERGPNIYLQTDNGLIRLDEESVSMLDRIRIANVDLDIRPFDWEINGNSGRTAYLQSMKVTQLIEDRFAPRHTDDSLD